MNPLWMQVVTNTASKKTNPLKGDYNFRNAKKYRDFKITIRRLIKDSILLLLGVFSAAFGLESFLLPNSFIDGGATGISLLLTEITKINLSYIIILINIPFVLLAFKVVNKQFAIKTAIAIITLSIVLATVHFPNVTKDRLLVAVFGGFFIGGGIGFAIRAGAVLDGTEVLAIFLSRKLGTTIGDIIIVVNIIIFSAGSYFLGIENALYSMITYLAASKTLDFFVEGIEEYIGVTIIATHHERIRKMIIEKLGRGVTTYAGKKGFGKRGEKMDVDILYTVITRLEINKLNSELEKIEPDAFVVMSSVKDTKGGMIKKRPLK